MAHVIIMAQGQQQRIGHMLGHHGMPAWKQLLPISEQETIFSRTCRLFREAGASAILAVVHNHPEWDAACRGAQVPMFIQKDPGPSVLNGIYNVQPFWGERTIIALGDVVYSRATVRKMVTDQAFYMYERPGRNTTTDKPFSERFGLSFGPENHDELRNALEEPGFRYHQDHKLGDLKERLKVGGVMKMQYIFDYTDDVDTEDGLLKWLPLLRKAAARDI